ncbi:5-formyltetrahydrofolate cyclo-ligase [Saccharothrix syringae]|uniref:5-formyltetrahydrofolate cyclo-ligase n=1 Tax=Saccharothrix syringae TaxID=103733 RepID=A0A5Q0GT02_SACSY|nr:5-formyltetrahydrofolate cyclo-ligase [Saccharothrix syringae]QFZ16620.1 5-formyltetrahydrofolate cyclo-ligase [Saccharothrix syringae]
MTSGERDRKLTLRARLRALRRNEPVPDMSAEVLLAVAAFGVSAGQTVCAYLASRFEPGSLAMVEALRSHGLRVLLPVVAGAELDWAVHDGSLRAGAFGLREPAGPLLGVGAVASAALVLVPALAVDHAGVRLGKGGGYYDRALRLSTGPLVGVVRDPEFVPSLPEEPHDVRVHAVLTPSLGLVRLPL